MVWCVIPDARGKQDAIRLDRCHCTIRDTALSTPSVIIQLAASLRRAAWPVALSSVHASFETFVTIVAQWFS
jgi:hypothetical protein